MSFFRTLMVFCASAVAAFAFSQAGIAQEFKEISLAVESDSASGYMALGGGLEKVLVDEEPLETAESPKAGGGATSPERPKINEIKKKAENRERKQEAKQDPKPVAASHRRERPHIARSAPRRVISNATPIALVARTLDHTGTNVGMLQVQTPSQ